jgi:type 1 fimbria pilin
MYIRDVFFFASLVGILGCTSAAFSFNSCANVDVMGSFDRSGLQESEFGIYAAGTFRIAGEADEYKQPNFNLSTINCEKQFDDVGKASLECKVMQAIVWATSDKPDADKPNCSLDLNFSTYSMKELRNGVLTGIDDSTNCYNTMLTIDRNTKKVWMSFTKTKYAENYEKISPGACGMSRPTHVLMNCTGWPRIRKQGRTPPRYCDFSSAGDK